ncbi:chromosome partitioning protein ParA [Oleiagrimonas soli]|uniref:Chromosome partitioning protein ParA n=1 Tax=Oleiagrimonas soli TaxID=1543381 RepID=A0A099CUQ3_9GAMM|nr:chromosome partitioning protein ParA [Oleiagrimonas soli]
MASGIYEGWVRHRRHAPRQHRFRYRVAMLYIDLAELEQLFEGHRLWSLDRPNLAAFRREDYMGPVDLPLDEAVRRRVEYATGLRPRGPIRLLTHARYFGVIFNPVSFYYCYAPDGVTLETVVAEITNTPWKERHAYVLPMEQAHKHARAAHWTFPKTFHVSPFMAMQRDYAWRFTAPGDDLAVHMDVLDGTRREFDATLVLHRRPLNRRGLTRVLLRYPLMTLKVIVAIHWQALRLFLKRVPVYDHPRKQGS